MTFLLSFFPDSFRCLGLVLFFGLIFCSTKIVEAVRMRRRLERKDYNAILRRDDSVRFRL